MRPATMPTAAALQRDATDDVQAGVRVRLVLAGARLVEARA
jgi:hypothetical protein